ADATVLPMQTLRSGQCLLRCPEGHRKHNAEGLMEPANGIAQRSVMFCDCGRNPGMRKLQQRSPASRQEQGRLPIDLPIDRLRPEESFPTARRLSLQLVEQTLQLCGTDHVGAGRHDILMVPTTGARCDS